MILSSGVRSDLLPKWQVPVPGAEGADAVLLALISSTSLFLDLAQAYTKFFINLVPNRI